MLRGKVVPKARRRWGGFFHNDAEHRDFTAIGTAAGRSDLLCWVVGLRLSHVWLSKDCLKQCFTV